MQQVSQDWIDTQTQPFLPLNDVKIFYYGEDADIVSKFYYMNLYSGTGWDNTNSVVTDMRNKTAMYNKYITLDYGFVLDGTYTTIDNVGSTRGAITLPNVANTTSKIYIYFNEKVTTRLQYLTIKLSEVFGVSPYSISFKSYYSSTLLDTITITLQDNEFLVEQEVNFIDFDRLVIEITSAQDYVSTRVEQVVFGHYMVFEKKDIIKYSQKNTIEPCSFTLPTHTFDFELDNVDGKFNPDNPSGVYQYLKEGQQVSFVYGLKINNAFEYINGGTFYILSWEVPQNSITATFRTGSRIDLMGGIYDVTQLGTLPISNKSLSDIGSNAGSQSNVSIDTYAQTSMMQVIKPTIETDTGYRCNDILQLCANAGMSILKILRNGNVFASYNNQGTSSNYEITKDISYKNADYNIRRTLKEVVINDEHYTSVYRGGQVINFDPNGETQTINNPLLPQNYNSDLVNWVYNILQYNKIIKGEFRADPRLDVMDIVTVYNRYSNALPVLITTINYEYNGAIKGYYEGIVLQ